MASSRALDPQFHTAPFRFYITVNRRELPLLVLNMLFYGSGSATMIVVSYVLGRVVDAASTGQSGVSTLIGVLALCLLSYEGFYRLGHICEIKLMSRMRANIKKSLFDHTISLPFGYFADRFAGELAHKVSSTADRFERMTGIICNKFFEDGIAIPISAGLLYTAHPYYTIFILLWAVLLIIGSSLLVKEANRRSGNYAAAESRTTGSIVDIYGNISAMKVYGRKKNADTLHHTIDEEAQAYYKMGKWDVLMYHYHGLSIVAMCLGLIAITAYLYGHALISVGAIVFVSAAALRLFDVGWGMGTTVAEFIRSRGEAIQNLRDLVVAPAIVDGDHAGGSVDRRTRIEYRDITFGYSHEKSILDDFSIIIKPGEKLGIVGLSGAGKTTFANLLLRFFDPQKGQILLNGSDIRDFTQEYLRSHISYISQDTSLFHATIAENIAYGSDAASERDIERAAELAYADDFIAALPKGYQSVVGERGIKLSGGQRQRIAIARAILADRPLFLLDEATSALDSDSEAKIQKGLIRLMENKTVIAIAHRLSTLSHMDRIIFLENGKILEDGSHGELLARGGKYAKLWNMQAGGFLPADL